MFNIYCPVDDGYFIHFQGLLFSFKLLLDVPHQIIIIDFGSQVTKLIARRVRDL